ncbi:translation elongation factor Ts [Beggiatoa alba B18LD]|uniref:Elongation factor Ts n=1 Tax=Beggiatoa alba B18LD TaxID=395493 RepID=I3CKD6_9GAMM|nr:translation elongation factor Ts [Beggiatoa alba]EIJ44079.1 translation elongation factor Ts [Beggiatoa alba B18LD]
MTISAALVKELRERTGAGMMECKKALSENNGDIEAAIEAMRKAGQAKADKKAGRVAAEGLVVIQQDAQNAVIVEVNCETDFVSKGDEFKEFCDAIASSALVNKPADLEALAAAQLADGKTVDERRRELIAKIGENMTIRRFSLMPISGVVGAYLHGTRIGVLVDMRGGDVDLARDVAMHVAASRPVCVSAEQVDPDLIAKEKEIFIAQAQESGKPAEIIEKMIGGRVQKFLKEITLLGQPFVKDPDQTVEKLLGSKKATVASFIRFEVGEGIEKKVENFADEVMQQVKAVSG